MSLYPPQYGFLNPYSSGTVTVAASSHVIISSNNTFGAVNNLSPGAWAISIAVADTGTFASSALVTVSSTASIPEPNRKITYYQLSPMAGQVASSGSQTSNTVALIADSLSSGQWVAIGNTTSSSVVVNYSVIKFESQ